MGDKRNAYKFTIQFNAADPHNSRVIDILNAQGRRKAQFIVNAVLHYVSCTKQPEDIIAGKTDYGAIESIVKRVILSQTISDIKENESSQSNTKPKNKSENFTPVNLADDIKDDTLKGIVDSLDTFRRKNDENQ